MTDEIHRTVVGRARPVLFIVGNYLKERTFTSVRKVSRALGITTTQAGCALKVIGWKKHNPSSSNTNTPTYHR